MKASPGRRPGDPDITRQAILAGARAQFGAVGFDRATIRAIATTAEVDPALVHHYFGSKQELFVAAHQLPIGPSELFGSIAKLPVPERGAALVAGYLRVFITPGSAALSMVRAAATNENAATMLKEFVGQALIEHGAQIVEGPDPELRIALIGSHLLGLAFARELVGIEPLRRADFDQLVKVVAPVMQRYIDAPD